MMDGLFPSAVFSVGPLVVTDTVLTSLVVSVLLVLGLSATMRFRAGRAALEVVYETLERSVHDMVRIDARPLVPFILTLWAFITAANLAGLLPGVSSPTRDLSLTAALAFLAFLAGHVFAFRERGLAYLKHYLEPTPLLLPLNIIGEASRTVALALRLFGNMLSGQLILALALYLAGLLIPVPLMLLGVLTGVVQAYIFGILTLVFAASAMEVARRKDKPPTQATSEGGSS
jgi:F-type H+-transporting ATPase subunit a